MQNQNTSTIKATDLDGAEILVSETRDPKPKVDDPGVFCISAVVKVFDPDTQEIFVETRA